MIAVLLILWIVGLVLLIFDPRKPSVRWLAGLAFCGSSGALSAVISDYFQPYAEAHAYPAAAQLWLDRVQAAASLVQYYGLPYTFVMFAACYHPEGLPVPFRRALPYAAAAPALFILLAVRPLHPLPFRAVAPWALTVVAVGAWLVFSRRETQYPLRRNHMFTALAIVPAVVFCSVMNYFLPVLGITEMWRYNTWAILIAFAIFLTALTRYGFLDMQLLISRRRLDASLRAVTSGTAVLNHAIKNDVAKLLLFADKIQSHAQHTGQAELSADIRVIESAATHIQDMIAKVKDQTQDLALKLEPLDLSDLLLELSQQVSLGLPPGVEARWEAGEGAREEVAAGTGTGTGAGELPVWADRAQLLETLQNLINNAVEAMPGGGQLTVRAYSTPKWIIVEVRDTGVGMSRSELRKVLEPFYTTKTATHRNFGLGLSYCYHVMKKHKGALYLESEPGQGTVCAVHFPRRKEGGGHGVSIGHSAVDRRG